MIKGIYPTSNRDKLTNALLHKRAGQSAGQSAGQPAGQTAVRQVVRGGCPEGCPEGCSEGCPRTWPRFMLQTPPPARILFSEWFPSGFERFRVVSEWFPSGFRVFWRVANLSEDLSGVSGFLGRQSCPKVVRGFVRGLSPFGPKI